MCLEREGDGMGSSWCLGERGAGSSHRRHQEMVSISPLWEILHIGLLPARTTGESWSSDPSLSTVLCMHA